MLPRSHELSLVEDARTSAVPNVSPATNLTPVVLAKFSKETQMSLKKRAALSHPGADKAEVLYLHACHCQELASVTRCTKKSEVHIVEIVSSHQSSSPKSADHLSALEEDFPFESDRGVLKGVKDLLYLPSVTALESGTELCVWGGKVWRGRRRMRGSPEGVSGG